MRLSIVSHSLVAPRQAIFANILSTNFGLEVQQIYPLDWNDHHREGGFETSNTGDMQNFDFFTEADGAIARHSPDILYVQQEAYCHVVDPMLKLAQRIHSKFVLFIWDNLKQEYEGDAKHVLESADLVICGNSEAETFVKKYNPKTTILPQVGVDFDLFRPLGMKREYDGVFVGRPVEEKGINVVRTAFADTDYQIWYASGIPYHGMNKVFNRAKVHLLPSIDVPFWHEQFSPYSNLEAIGCGCNVVTSDSKAIVEWLTGCPGVSFVHQNDPDGLRAFTQNYLETFEWGTNALDRDRARVWVRERFSNQVVAEKLIAEFRKL